MHGQCMHAGALSPSINEALHGTPETELLTHMQDQRESVVSNCIHSLNGTLTIVSL